MKKIENMFKFSLCCGKAKCPEVSVIDSEWIIKDDFGGSVKLNEDQIKEFINHQAVKTLNE